MKYKALLLLYFLSIYTLFSQIVNEGTLKINTATLVSFGNEYTITSTGTHNNEGNLYLNSNFINHGTVSIPISGTTFFNSSVNDTQTISGTTGNVNFYNLEVNVTGVTKKGVSVADGFDLEVVNMVNLVSGDLRLVGEAQLVQTHTGANANTPSSGKLLRDQQGISSTYGYNYWSSPVNNNTGAFSFNGGLFDGTDASINSFVPQQVLINYGSPYNGSPAMVDGSNNVITPLYISDRWLYTYSPNTSGYAGWDKINKDLKIAPGIGFTMKGTGAINQNYVFKGLPNDGDYTFPIVIGQSTLLGNPYPSAMDSDKFITDNLQLLDKLLFWVDGGSNSHILAAYLGGYSIYNLTGGVGPSINSSISGLGSAAGTIPKQYMAVGQGFMVEAISNGIITFNNSQRSFQTEDGEVSNFYKQSNTKKSDSQADTVESFIRMGYEDPELFHRQLLLAFLPNRDADLNFNRGFDATMIDPREDEMFYIIENDLTKKYVIQGVGTYDNIYEFPIGIIITQQGKHVIMLDAVENFTDPVYIKDSLLNTYYNLSESNFSPNLPPGEYLDRFSIVFQATETLNNTKEVLTNNNISAYFKNDAIIIKNKNLIGINQVTVFNVLGQKIESLNRLSHDDNIIIPFVHQKGMYIVLIESGQNKKSFKIIN
ncbi:T9SS type A sorting domain-containing protein [Confluentibacter flavum]|uniref:ABC transporter permease n=1 Tax=Confluentibacter flavum TaxID=1909700 RepID=A0A2N3HJW7_9FLAO|nr:T9SS type A sorting domain-containing protein [Confluentibacter flavum]PKQ45231.1 ABC transporter permease [Confluentibacter flavum]